MALLDQRALSGIGNMHKSETLFQCGVDPFAPVRALDDESLRRLLAMARQGRPSRTTYRCPLGQPPAGDGAAP